MNIELAPFSAEKFTKMVTPGGRFCRIIDTTGRNILPTFIQIGPLLSSVECERKNIHIKFQLRISSLGDRS